MIRATTPKHAFVLPFDYSEIQKLRIIYAQDDNIVLEKTEEDVTFNANKIHFTLSQEETNLFDDKKPIELQVRVLTKSDNAIASRIYHLDCKKVLDDEVL